MVRTDRGKSRIRFLWLAFVGAMFFGSYSFLLMGYVTPWNAAFFISFILLYFSFRLALPYTLWSIVRLVGALMFILLSLVNFAHFKIFDSFITGSSGFGRMPNLSEASLLSDYWSTVPFVLYAAAALLMGYLVYLEFFWRYDRRSSMSLRRLFVLGVLAVSSLVLCTLPTLFPSRSWYSARYYYGDIGPIGYLGVNLAQSIFDSFAKHRENNLSTVSADKNVTPADHIISLLSELAVPSQSREITLPVFKSQPNVIVYQLESVPAWAVNLTDTPMPFLKDLMSKGITVDHFYGNDCHTIGAEFTSVCSLLTSSVEVIGNRLEPLQYSCLPKILSTSAGYDTNVYHANVSSFWNRDTLLPQIGYSNLYFSPFFTPRAYDGIVADKLTEKIKDAKAPEFSYLIGFTSHGPHTAHYIERTLKESNVTVKPLTGPLPNVTQFIEVPEEELRNYFGFLRVVDDAIRGLFTKLNESGAIDNTIVVLYGDHRYYNFTKDDGQHYKSYNELPFVMWVPGMSPGKIPITASHMDIGPTIADLLGVKPEQSAHFMGKSIFSPSRYNFALGKCADEVYYFTSDTVIRGNQKTGLYAALNTSNNKTEAIDPDRLQKIKDIASLSDQIWSYGADVLLPDKTLVKGSSTDIYLIDSGRKRRIESEQVFTDLGYSWLDIHQLSDELLSKYPIGEPIRDASPHLQRAANTTEEQGAILRVSSTFSSKKYIAHALGSAGGVTGCNCREAFEESYAKGFRIFELDLALTKDKKIVLFHPGNEANIGSTKNIGAMTEDEFMKSKFKERLTLMNLEDLFKLMEKYPDMYSVLDMKEEFGVIMPQFVGSAKRTHPSILSRVIPQIYSPDQLAVTTMLYNFNDIIYTLYLTEPTDESVLSFVKTQKKITAITSRDTRYNTLFKSKLAAQDIGLFVHTVNDKTAIQKFVDQGVGVYTDALEK